MIEKNAAGLLPAKQAEILERWLTQQFNDKSLRGDLMSNEDLTTESADLLSSVLAGIRQGKLTDTSAAVFSKTYEVLAGISVSRAKRGFTPRETAYFVFSLKDSMVSVLEKNISKDRVLFSEVSKIVALIDSLALMTLEPFIRGHEEVIFRQTAELSDIATPVLQVWDGILALPIIGTLDSARAQVVMENLLIRIVETGSTVAILDISGVPAVDSLVAYHLINTVSATRLMGAECIISGIRPEIAQMIVQLGIDLSTVKTMSSLAHALQCAFTLRNLEVCKTSESNKSAHL